MTRRVRSSIPTYTGDARPAHLRTAQELGAQGLKPGTATPDAPEPGELPEVIRVRGDA